MRVALFIDGNNYYLALRDYDSSIELDMERLAAWLVRSVGGRLARFVGAYYYTGVIEGAADTPLGGFLSSLETRTGYFVRREPRVRRTSLCKSCGSSSEYFTEKRVDTRLVAEMIHLAAVGGYDAACLLSGDDDFLPALQAVGALGKQVYLATWPGQRVARELRANSFGVLDLAQGVSEFSTGRKRPSWTGAPAAPAFGSMGPAGASEALFEAHPTPIPAAACDTSGALTAVGQALLDEIRQAQVQLAYVSRWYFTNKWRGATMPADALVRERLIEELVAAGALEAYTATDAQGRGTQAIRTVDSSVRPEGVESGGRAVESRPGVPAPATQIDRAP